MKTFVLTYFDFDGGRAEPFRITMSRGGVSFTDKRISFPEFGELRSSLPLSAVPILNADGTDYTQSKAMTRYAGRLTNLYPEDPWEAFLCDEAIDIVDDAMVALIGTFGMEGNDMKSAREELANGVFRRCLLLLGKRIEDAGGKYVCDNRLTIADLMVYVWCRSLGAGHLDHIPVDIVETVSATMAGHRERIAADPCVREYYEARGN